MNYKKTLSLILTLLPFAIIIGLSFFVFFYITPDKLVSFIGTKNAFVLMFVASFISGITTFNGIPYLPILITLAAGGLDPFYLGLASAMGITTGDSTSYYIGYQGASIESKRVKKFSERMRGWMEKYPKAFPVFCFLYGSIFPMSNDFITISSGLARYPFWKMTIPLGIGNIIFNVTLATIASGY